MNGTRFAVLAALAAVLLAGAVTLLQTPAVADGHDVCPKRPIPPPASDVCRACPSVVDPVTCTIVCSGGPRERTFTNQCVASCSGFIILGECRRTGS